MGRNKRKGVTKMETITPEFKIGKFSNNNICYYHVKLGEIVLFEGQLFKDKKNRINVWPVLTIHQKGVRHSQALDLIRQHVSQIDTNEKE